MDRGRINSIEDRAKTAAQGGFDRALVELLEPKSQTWLAVIATSIQVSSFVVFVSAGLFIYQHINSLIFALLFGAIIASLNWIFNAVVLNGAIPPWLTPGEIEDYDDKRGRKLSTFLIAVFWSMMNALYFSLSVISLFFEEQVKQFISADFIRLQMMGGGDQSAQSMFELGLDKPSLLHLIEFALSDQGLPIFLMLVIGINVLISLPMILKLIFSKDVWTYRKLQHDDARGRILAGYEQHQEMLKKTLERYDLVPEDYISAWDDPPFNTKSSKHEEPTFIEDEEMFSLFDEGEAEAAAEARAQEEGEVDAEAEREAEDSERTESEDDADQTDGPESAKGDDAGHDGSNAETSPRDLDSRGENV